MKTFDIPDALSLKSTIFERQMGSRLQPTRCTTPTAVAL